MQKTTDSEKLPALTPPTQALTTASPYRAEKALLATVQAVGTRELARQGTEELREMVADLSAGLTRQTATEAPKLFQLKRTLGAGTVVKLLVVVLRCFVDSVRVPDKMQGSEILETAEILAETYTHDSVKDIVLALREARLGGFNFYQSVDASKVFAIVAAYFEKKADWLQSQHLDRVARSSSLEHNAVAQLTKHVPAVAGVGQRLDPAHPNHDSLRRALTITNGRAKRGFITAEQAQEQRQRIQQANQRKPRADWQPRPDAQRRIEAANRAEDARLAEKYRTPSQ